MLNGDWFIPVSDQRHWLGYLMSATKRTKVWFGWNAKGQGTSGVAPKRRREFDERICAWMVAMETDAKLTN